jgi:DivIVA domain-containing protein
VQALFALYQEGATMALTPEEVVNKRFTIVKFREGYDQDEVDDFLDAVVVELRRLGTENDELRQQLQAAKAQADAAPAVSASDFPVAPVVAAAVPSAAEASNSHSLLELARKLHEEHVREGLTKRDQLIRDGQENSARLVRDAEAQARAVLGQLELDRKAIENTIDELREFEHDYRGRLREYIESQLTTLIREESFEQPLEAAAKIEFAAITEVAAEPVAEVEVEDDEDELEAVVTSSDVEDEDETRSERN